MLPASYLISTKYIIGFEASLGLNFPKLCFNKASFFGESFRVLGLIDCLFLWAKPLSHKSRFWAGMVTLAFPDLLLWHETFILWASWVRAVRDSAFWLAMVGVDNLSYDWGIDRGREPLTFWSHSPGICPFQLAVGGDVKCWQPESRRGTKQIVAQCQRVTFCQVSDFFE